MDQRPGLDSCIIVGAGIAGLMAARALVDRGFEVVVLDKARGVGGRMATRRVDLAAGDPGAGRAVWDHGAQFFTARDGAFKAWIDAWLDAGVARIWAHGFPGGERLESADGHRRYRGGAGMSEVPKHLSRGIDVRLNARVVEIEETGGHWRVRTDGEADGETGHRAGALILTPPAPQSLALVDAGGVQLPQTARASLERITYAPCIALLVHIDGASRVPEPGGVRLDGEPIGWIADNRKKGISPEATTLTVHAGPGFSHAHWNSGPDEVARLLLEAVAEWIGGEILSTQVHRWRYSQPVDLHPEPCLVSPGAAPLVFAGDAFGGPRVEGAALSGLAAAAWLISRETTAGARARNAGPTNTNAGPTATSAGPTKTRDRR